MTLKYGSEVTQGH